MMHRAQAKVILDSVSPEGIRLTTVQVRFWRPMLPELNTHRAISKNAGSSRARPSKAIIDQVRNDPWGPIHWGKNQSGMQAHEELTGWRKWGCRQLWKLGAKSAAFVSWGMWKLGAHKQIANRPLETYTYVDDLVTATDWNNFFALRLHEDAQHEMYDVARAIKSAMDASEPTLFQPGEWHLPYVTDEDWIDAHNEFGTGKDGHQLVLDRLKRLSVSRCAKISYTAFDGTVEPIEKELDRYRRLMESQPCHSSPAEHQATPDELFIPIIDCFEGWVNPHQHGNLRGWRQLRKTLPNEYVEG